MRPSGVDTTPEDPTMRSSSERNAGLSATEPSPYREQAVEKGSDARRRLAFRDERRPLAGARRYPSRSAREAYSLYVERAAEGANDADGPLSAACYPIFQVSPAMRSFAISPGPRSEIAFCSCWTRI